MGERIADFSDRVGVHGQRSAECFWQLAYPGRQTIALCGDGGFTMLGMGDLLTQVERKTPVIHILPNNESLDFMNIEQQEAGYIPYGVVFKNPNFAPVAEAMGAKGI
jgi:pyruvate dehydrogenase (quinone)